MKKNIFLFLVNFLVITNLHAEALNPSIIASTPSKLESYFQHIEQYPRIMGPLGNALRGEIEIILDKDKIAEIEKITGREVGLMYKDKYWIWLNDAVRFPNQKLGVYGRILWVNSLKGTPGVAVMAVLPDGKIALNRNFRHATRSFEYELPRGAVNPDEALEDAARREVREETGMIIKNLHLLGKMAPDSGVLNTVVPLYLAKVERQEKPTPEDSEAIASIDAFTVQELRKGLVDGYLEVKVEGQIKQVPLRDPFFAYALLLADIKQLLK